MAKSLYIHIPFCNQICSYCDFPKVFSAGQNTDAYLDALLVEIAQYEKTFGFASLQTIYIGGGTPTVLTIPQLERLFGYLHTVIDFSHLKEISIEANPESLNDAYKVACLKRLGVNRVSLGVQTFQENLLHILERSHTKQDVCDVVKMLHEANFEINVDLIFAIPTQTMTDVADDIDMALSLPITHISAYSLILEENTKFFIANQKAQLELTDNDLEAQMFEYVIDRLTSSGFEHYEISNFTKNIRSHHNITYWENGDYIGVGLGAHGHLQSTRYENTRSITKYKRTLSENQLPILKQMTLTAPQQLEEAMFLGLRLLDGIHLATYNKRYNIDVQNRYEEKIKKRLASGDLQLKNGCLSLTRKGLMFANDVFEEFLI